MNNTQRLGNRGVIAVISVVVVGVVIALIGVIAFYVLKGGKVAVPDYRSDPTQVETEPSDQGLPEISNSDEVDVIEKELDQTSEGSFDSDFEALDEEASSL